MGVKEMISNILNSREEKEENGWTDFSINKEVEETINIVNTINIVDLKGKKFRFPGSYQMVIKGKEVTFKATKK